VGGERHLDDDCPHKRCKHCGARYNCSTPCEYASRVHEHLEY
jgi:hypothetical protein